MNKMVSFAWLLVTDITRDNAQMSEDELKIITKYKFF